MTVITRQPMPRPDPMTGSTIEYYDNACPNLLDRWLPVERWVQDRIDTGVLPYCKINQGPPSNLVSGLDVSGRKIGGVNMANQDYLNLGSHPAVLGAANRSIADYGVHSAGSAALMGLTVNMVALERAMAAFLACREATVFPTGWGAGYGVIRALVRPQDHIVIDVLAHACLQEAAAAATPNVHRFPHLSTDGVARRLSRLRENFPDAGILVVTESLFSMDSDTPDIGSLQLLCARHRATLMVDVAHDLGALGPTGRGALELQGMLGEVDVVMGSFSKVFASNGGFVASHHPALRHALRFGSGPQTFSNALSPVQAGAVLAALQIVQSDEGATRRDKLMRNALDLRARMEGEGFKVLGEPSAIVPIIIGDDGYSRRLTAAILQQGGVVNLVEHPAVARNACRWRLQVMSDHQPADITDFVAATLRARALAEDAAWQPARPTESGDAIWPK